MMLKPLNQPRLRTTSGCESPRFHQYQYGTSSPHLIASKALRRVSEPAASPSLAPAPAPTPSRQISYVSRGTQYSPMIQKMVGSPPSLPPLGNLMQRPLNEENIPQVVAAPPLPTAIPIPQTQSPIIKKRHSPDKSPLAVKSNQELPTKRVRSAQAPIKVLPLKYELCDVEDMVILIANMISELIQTNDGLPLRSNVLTRFHSRTPPGISVMDYLQRLAKHATLTPPLLLSMVYYIDRLCSLYPAFTITTLTVHRFLITAATVAAKGLSDSFWNNATYARVGGIKIGELGLLELDFLYRVDWKIVPNPEVLVDYYKGLVERSDGYELEGDDNSSDEDDALDDSEKELADTPKIKLEGATDLKWREWMDDVSSQKAVKQEALDETKMSKEDGLS